MITVLVTFAIPEPVTYEEARDIFKSTAPRYRGVEGLVRKSYIWAEGGSIVGALYTWQSRAEAESFYNDSWRSFVRAKYQVDPVLRHFDNPVIVDNIANEIIS